MTFTVNVFLSCIRYHICHRTFFFGDAATLLRETSSLVWRNYCPRKSRVYFRWVACICAVSGKNKLKFHVTLRSLIGLFNWFIKSDKSGRQAKTIQNVAGGNFTRGFAARKFPRGRSPRGNMVAPLARSRIPPATQATVYQDLLYPLIGQFWQILSTLEHYWRRWDIQYSGGQRPFNK